MPTHLTDEQYERIILRRGPFTDEETQSCTDDQRQDYFSLIGERRGTGR